MKIAMIIDAWDPIVGWGQVHVRNLCEKLVTNHGCHIDLFVRSLRSEDSNIYNQDEVLLNGKFRILRCGRPRSFFSLLERTISIFSICLRIYQEHRKKPYNLVHAHAFLGLLAGKIISSILKIRIIATVHGANFLDRGSYSFSYFIEKLLLTSIKYDLEISVWQSFLNYKNINTNRVVIPNGINPEEFNKMEILPRDDIFKILFVGRLEWTKGIDILIEAVRLLHDEYGNVLDEKHVEFHLVGYGYQEKEYRSLVQSYGLEKYIFFKWKKTGEDLIKEYKESKLFVLPSRTEWFGITILEAMACNVLVIATKCGGPEDIIENEVNWFLVEKENPQQLAKIIKKHINQNGEVTDLIRWKAKDKIFSQYTWTIIAYTTYHHYENITKLNKNGFVE